MSTKVEIIPPGHIQGWEKQQYKTFAKWANINLRSYQKPELLIRNLEDDLADGVRLIKLIEYLREGESLGKFHANPKNKIQQVENLNLVTKVINDCCNSLGLKLQYSAENIQDGDLPLVMGMFWILVSKFCMANISEDSLTAKEGLMLWCKKKLEGYDIPMSNFTTHWLDGKALVCLIHRHRPDLVPEFPSYMSNRTSAERLEFAFDVAEKELGVPQLIDVEDMADGVDDKSMMTYLSYFWKVFAAMQQGEMAARRVANMVEIEQASERLRNSYKESIKIAASKIQTKIDVFNAMDLGETLHDAQTKSADFVQKYKRQEKKELSELKTKSEEHLNVLKARLKANDRPPYVAADPSEAPEFLRSLWSDLIAVENRYETALREAIISRRRMDALMQDVNDCKRMYGAKALALTKAMQRQGVQFLGPVIWLDQCTDLDELKSKLTQLKAYRCGMKGALMAEKSTLEVRLTALQTKLKFEKLDPFAPDVGLRISDVEDAWKELVESEQTYESMVNACLKKVLQEEELISQITKKGESLKLWAGTTSENIEEDTSAEPATLSEAEVALFGFEDVFVRSGLDAARGRLRRSCMEEGVGEARWGGTRLMVEGIRVGRGTGLQLMKKEHTAKVFKLQTLQDLVKQSEKDHNRVNVQAQKVLEAVEAVMTAVAPKIVEALCWGQGKVQKWREIEKKKMELSQDAERLAFECQSLAEEMQKGTNCDSVSDAEKQIQQVVQRWQAFKQDKGAHLQALQQRHDDLVGKGSRNPYSRYSVQDIQELLDVAEGAATNRGQQLKELHQLHTHNDELCKQFSLAAENLDAWLNEMKNKVDKAGSGEKNMEMQLAALDEVEKEVAVGSSKVALAEEADQAVIEAGIVENSFTDKSMFELQMSWDLLNTMLREKRAVLEARLSMTKDRTGIQQREEMIELFRNFDKDGSGSLTGVELRAALTSQDVEIGDEKVEKLVKGGGMNQEKFVEFMIEHYKDTDTYEQMLEAFQTLSRAEPVIDKATLEKPPCTTFLKPEGVTFLCDQMPPAETVREPRVLVVPPSGPCVYQHPRSPAGAISPFLAPSLLRSLRPHSRSLLSLADHSATSPVTPAPQPSTPAPPQITPGPWPILQPTR
ncbi:hypothetical protein CYMTET_6198 [Cymbomonas tetramitiformis]|uniref:Uncharacterized protein n=1 Tax=Cymbomonas tetramitiformis TaxID=36881 RepID=A0AAE0GY54_9CHLO|nr:hypothetical protein CYMTET_6198 [Cymbomonas tetramitiformis]